MQIIWEGKDVIKIIGDKNTILINADKKSDATVVLSQNLKEEDSNGAFIISNPGEYEVNDDFFYVDLFTSKEGQKSLVYKINVEDINIVDLNNINSQLELSTTENDSNNYENIIDNKLDILILGIGEGFLSPKEAATIKNELSPKIVIAINYDLDSDKDVKRFHEFKASFVAISEPQDKFKITKKNLPGPDDETMLIILNKVK